MLRSVLQYILRLLRPEAVPLPAGGTKTRRALLTITVVLLVIAASRITRLNTLEMDEDEIWSIWQTFGTPSQVVAWTPYDWSPAPYLTVWTWQALTGIHPFTVRLLTIYGFLLAMALLYRVTSMIVDRTAALIAVAACSGMGYAIHTSLWLRGYPFLFMLLVLGWWLLLRHLRRPSLLNGILAGAALAGAFYMHTTALFAVLTLIAFTFVLYGRKAMHWLVPGLTALALVAPEAMSKSGLAGWRSSWFLNNMDRWFSWDYLKNQSIDIYRDFAGTYVEVWIALVLLAGLVIVVAHRLQRRGVGLLLWMVTPIAFSFVGAILQAFTVRHLAWVMLGFAIWIGWGLAWLPRAAMAAAVALLLALNFAPVPFMGRYKLEHPAMVQTLGWLARQIRPGDVLLLDPNFTAARPEAWDYFSRVYFGSGAPFVSEPGSTRRVWYIADQRRIAPATFQPTTQNRILRQSYGSPDFTLQLYEAPPDLQGHLFSNGLRFHGFDLPDRAGPLPVWHEGDPIRIRLWWSVDKPLDGQVNVETYVTDSNNSVIAQTDSPPQLAADEPSDTSRWISGRYYVEDRVIQLPYPMAGGRDITSYPFYLAIHPHDSRQRISTPQADSNSALLLFTVKIKAW